MKEGIWLREENRGTELEGKTIGIIGYGHTGTSFAKKLLGFDAHIIAYDKYNIEGIPAHIVASKSLDQIYEEADLLSFHVPLQQDTLNYFNEDFLEKMHKPFILINTSRGPVVNTFALLKGVKVGKILGACLDVFEREPLSNMGVDIVDQLTSMPNIVLTPHIAGYTFEALYKMSRALLNKIEVL